MLNKNWITIIEGMRKEKEINLIIVNDENADPSIREKARNNIKQISIMLDNLWAIDTSIYESYE